MLTGVSWEIFNWSCAGMTFFVLQMAVLATTIYLHRCLTHRSLTLSPGMDFFNRCVIWITTGQDRKQWVAVHSKHHTFTDKPGDPHSPLLLGFWYTWFWNFWLYGQEAKNPETIRKHSSHIIEDWWDVHFFKRGFIGLGLGVFFLFLIGFGFFGFQLGALFALVVGVSHFLLYVFGVAPAINVLGHWSGQQNFLNTARNSRLLAWLTGGESLHNNHHNNQSSPKFSERKREFDPGWFVIQILVWCGVATLTRQLKVAP